MRFDNSIIAVALLSPVALAAPEAKPAAAPAMGVRKYGWQNYNQGQNYNQDIYYNPGTAVYSVTGTVAVPRLMASAALASATATVDSSGSMVQGQAVLKTIGNGPGMCPQDANVLGYFNDAASGRSYNLYCGQDISTQGGISRTAGVSWSQCLNLCATTRNCDSVVYSRLLWVCWTKSLASLSAPLMNNNTDRYFAFLPSAQKVPFNTFVLPKDDTLDGFTTAKTTTTTIAATGAVTVSGDTTSGTVVSATASVSNGTTVAVNVLIRWP